MIDTDARIQDGDQRSRASRRNAAGEACPCAGNALRDHGLIQDRVKSLIGINGADAGQKRSRGAA
jgi:hypothetical protein